MARLTKLLGRTERAESLISGGRTQGEHIKSASGRISPKGRQRHGRPDVCRLQRFPLIPGGTRRFTGPTRRSYSSRHPHRSPKFAASARSIREARLTTASRGGQQALADAQIRATIVGAAPERFSRQASLRIPAGNEHAHGNRNRLTVPSIRRPVAAPAELPSRS